jgi:pyrroloquinoline quinone biosynthesis protein D
MEVLAKEIERAMTTLKSRGELSPYFIGQQLVDYDALDIHATNGGLTAELKSKVRLLLTDVRVGSHELDSTHPLDGEAGSSALTMAPVPSLWRLARLQFDPVRNQRVLLYPEGVVLLNDTGAAVLDLCDGRRTVAEIASVLGERFDCDVRADVLDYLSGLENQALVHG